MTIEASVAIIGGSGLYELFDPSSAEFVGIVEPNTAFGEPSAPITVADIGGRNVAFLPRHGISHQYPAHAIPYRANLVALRDLGVRRILAPCAVGSLLPEMPPGSLVIPDQLVDHTRLRPQSIYDRFDDKTVHVSFADPYCQPLREVALAAADSVGWPAIDGATLVVIDGPRFSTRAETQWYASAGWSLVNMTGHPEAVLARECGICYCSLAVVTNYSANLRSDSSVTEAEVFTEFAANVGRLREVLRNAVTMLADDYPTMRCC